MTVLELLRSFHTGECFVDDGQGEWPFVWRIRHRFEEVELIPIHDEDGENVRVLKEPKCM